jgi:glycosyltransferase involved in cell wall biosynthesis
LLRRLDDLDELSLARMRDATRARAAALFSWERVGGAYVELVAAGRSRPT